MTVSDRGFIPVDRQMRTNVPHIFAIGDIVGQPMLAHKATHEAKVAAEVAHGEEKFFFFFGLMAAKGIAFEKAAFPGPPMRARSRWVATTA